MDLKQIKDQSRVLGELKNEVIALIGDIRKNKDTYNEKELINKLILLISLELKGNSVRDNMLFEMSKISIFSEDMIKNLSITAGSTSDIFISEFGRHSEKVLEVKVDDIRQKVANSYTKVGDRIDQIEEDNKKRSIHILTKVNQQLKPILDRLNKNFKSGFITFIISIFGGFVSINLYQWFVSLYL